MGRLIYSITTSLDGFVADKNGDFDWAMPSEEVHAFVNDIERNIGTLLLGKKMYETLAVWDTIRNTDSDAMNEFAKLWLATKKIVFSTSLSEVSTKNTTIVNTFNLETIKKQIAESDKDFGVGGPSLAAGAIKAGIVDEFHQFIVPVIIGSGNYWLPKDVETQLELTSLKKFDNGFVYLHYNKV